MQKNQVLIDINNIEVIYFECVFYKGYLPELVEIAKYKILVS